MTVSTKSKAIQSEEFIVNLTNTLFTPENIQRANEYIATRKLNPGNLKFPWVASGSDPAPFEYFRNVLPPVIFTECLYIPIVEIDSDPLKPTLSGFDVRYLGTTPNRLRWAKRKKEPTAELHYNVHSVLSTDKIIITESAMDAESFRLCGYEAISPLTSLFSPRFVHYLVATGCQIYLAYDNDDDGRKATNKILQYVAKYPPVQNRFRTLVYPFKDPNKALETLGVEGLKTRIAFQIG